MCCPKLRVEMIRVKMQTDYIGMVPKRMVTQNGVLGEEEVACLGQ
jgi:hypothetical protein